MAAERVEQVPLPVLVEQPLLVVLAVDLHQRARHQVQAPGRHGLVVEPGERPSPGAHLADRDQRLRDAVEQRLDPRALRPVPDERRVRARPEREPERVDQQALARAGLAGEDVQAVGQLEPQAVDEREVGDRELEQPARPDAVIGHDGRSSTLVRSRSQNGIAPAGSMNRIGRSMRADLHDVADRDPPVLAAIDRDQRLVGVGHPGPDDLPRRHDDRADRGQVPGDRRHDEVPAVGLEDRAAGGEGVAGGACGAGDDEPVRDERREVRLVDADVEPARPARGSRGRRRCR